MDSRCADRRCNTSWESNRLPMTCGSARRRVRSSPACSAAAWTSTRSADTRSACRFRRTRRSAGTTTPTVVAAVHRARCGDRAPRGWCGTASGARPASRRCWRCPACCPEAEGSLQPIHRMLDSVVAETVGHRKLAAADLDRRHGLHHRPADGVRPRGRTGGRPGRRRLRLVRDTGLVHPDGDRLPPLHRRRSCLQRLGRPARRSATGRGVRAGSDGCARTGQPTLAGGTVGTPGPPLDHPRHQQ